jgi:Copine
MGAYSTALRSVSLAGPTLFGPVINRAAEIAAHSLSYSQNKYFILLIITVSCNVLAFSVMLLVTSKYSLSTWF